VVHQRVQQQRPDLGRGAFDDDHVSVRDSKDPASAILTFTRTEWAAFVRSTTAGEFAPKR
jgi:hypothetical protein